MTDNTQAQSNLDEFTEAYIECALWSSTDEDGTPLDSKYNVTDLALDCALRMVVECTQFQNDYWDLISNDVARAGHDFWLTRNGHGAGFWDGDWPEPAATVLTEASQKFGEVNLYVGDDGRIYA